MIATSTAKYTKQDIEAIFSLALPELIYRAQTAHRQYHNPSEIQFCTLSSIKTGACPEDCNYCSQSARYDTGLKVEPLIPEEQILTEASAAKANGSTRFSARSAVRSSSECSI
jgi:biotin synthase